MHWRDELNGWGNFEGKGLLTDEEYFLAHRVCEFPRYYPKRFSFLKDPVTLKVNDENWVWATDYKVTTMYGVPISKPFSPPPPSSFRPKLAPLAKACLDTLDHGVIAKPSWDGDLWNAENEVAMDPDFYFSYTLITQKNKTGLLLTRRLRELLTTGTRQKLWHDSNPPAKVSLTSDGKICIARPEMVIAATVWRNSVELNDPRSRVNAEIVLQEK